MNIINDLFQFAKIMPSFDISFTQSIWEKFQETGTISESQKKSLVNIYRKWRVKEHLKKMQDE